MKTTIKSLAIVFSLFLTTLHVTAQNYKAPTINASGKVTDATGKHIGNIDKNGTITDARGTRLPMSTLKVSW